MSVTVNPDMLTLAREIRGLTQTQLAESSNIRQAKISRYEGGVTDIHLDDLEVFATALRFPTDFFLQEGSRLGAGTSEIFHRRRRTVRSKDLKRIDGLVNLHRLGSRQLLKAFDPVSPSFIPCYAVDELDDIGEIASAVRATWSIPPGPVHNLIGWLEQASCLVFSCDFETDKIDEVVQWIHPYRPIILVNSTAPADRLRFSLAHALGHLVMHRGEEPYKEMEKEADQFAAEFLMPASDIVDELVPVTINHMLELKQYWKVSMAALIYRAKVLGVITERQSTSLFQQRSRLGYTKNEPFPISRETPRLVRNLIDGHKELLGYSDEELAKLLKVSLADYHKWYYPRKIIEFPTKKLKHADHLNPPSTWEM